MSKGERFNEGKPELSMVLEARHGLQGIAQVLMFGRDKYARGNWRNGLSHTQIMDSLLRHSSKYLSGEDLDDESGLPHVYHVACNALFLAEMISTHPELDDRPKVAIEKTSGTDDEEYNGVTIFATMEGWHVPGVGNFERLKSAKEAIDRIE